MLDYKVEKRQDDYYVITNEKYKNKVITINLSSILKSITLNLMPEIDIFPSSSIELIWCLNYNEEQPDLIAIDLYANPIDGDKDKTFKTSCTMSLDILVQEAISCMKDNLLDKAFIELNKTINKAYYNIFLEITAQVKALIFSDFILPIKAVVYNNENKKIYGYANRICIDRNTIGLCEYVGKPLENEFPSISFIINDNNAYDFTTNANIYDLNNQNQSLSLNAINYYKYTGLWHTSYNIYELNTWQQDEIKETKTFLYELEQKNNAIIPELNMPSIFTDITNMRSYILTHNTLEAINSFKSALRPTIQQVNINAYMSKEYTINN